jgi:FkbM family methyltransferase
MTDRCVIEYDDDMYSFSGPENDHIFRIIKGGSCFYEADLLNEIKKLDLKGTYVDVGANIGNHSLFFSTHCRASKVISIEPTPRAFRYLVENVSDEANSAVEFLNCAVSDRSGLCSMDVIDPYNLGRSKVVTGNTTSVRTLDSILEFVNDVTFIKIDVEGHEVNVLNGAKQTLERCHPVLSIESSTPEELQTIKTILEPLGYKVSSNWYGLTPTYIWKYQEPKKLPTIAVMATLYERRETAPKVVCSIAPQVDEVCIVLNVVGDEDVESWKSCFNFIGMNVRFFVRHNEMGDAERYIPVCEDEAYYLSIDDDLIYPKGYVDMMVAGCKKYNCPVTLHGKFFPTIDVKSYINQGDARYYQCRNNLDKDQQVHTPGCCVVCWRQDQIDLNYEQFKVRNRSDIEVGRIAAERGTKIMCLAHEGLTYLPPAGKTIWDEETCTDNSELVRAINEVLYLYYAQDAFRSKYYRVAAEHFKSFSMICASAASMASARLAIAKCNWYQSLFADAVTECLQAIALNANFKDACLFMAEMSGPGNKKRWLQIADTATDEGVIRFYNV